jgi:hypothetical protein
VVTVGELGLVTRPRRKVVVRTLPVKIFVVLREAFSEGVRCTPSRTILHNIDKCQEVFQITANPVGVLTTGIDFDEVLNTLA